MAGELRIRFAVENDVGSIAAVAKKTWRATYEGLIPPEIQQVFLNRYYACDALLGEIKRGDAWFWVAERDGIIVGYAQVVMRQNNTAELTRLYVLPDEQRGGVGTALVKNALLLLRKLGVTTLIVVAEQENRRAVQFYKKVGFTLHTESTMLLGDQPLSVVELHLTVPSL